MDFRVRCRKNNMPCKHLYKLFIQAFGNNISAQINALNDIPLEKIQEYFYTKSTQSSPKTPVNTKQVCTSINNNTECVICLMDTGTEPVYKCSGACKQILGHTKCLSVWFKSKNTCPMCRSHISRVSTIPIPIPVEQEQLYVVRDD